MDYSQFAIAHKTGISSLLQGKNKTVPVRSSAISQKRQTAIEGMNKNLQAMKGLYEEDRENLTPVSILSERESPEEKEKEVLKGQIGMPSGMMGMPFTMPEVSKEQKAKDITEEMKKDKKVWLAYENMTGEEKKIFMELAEKFYCPFGNMGGMGMGGYGGYGSSMAGGENMPGGTSIYLLTLLKDGKLQNKDIEGKTLLENLNNFGKQKFRQGITGDFILGEILGKVSTPDFMKLLAEQNSSLTEEYRLTKDNPSEYTRIIKGLTSEEGEVKLQNGETLKFSDKSFQGQGFINCSSIFQASMEENAKNKTDREQIRKDIKNQIFKDNGALAAYGTMHQEEKDKFMTLAEKFYKPPMDERPGMTDEDLIKLLGKFYLQDRDSEGKDFLDNLIELEDQKFPPGINKDIIICEVIRSTARPESMDKKNFTDKMEFDLASSNAAEYIRIITGLTGEKGEVKLKDGSILKRNDEVVELYGEIVSPATLYGDSMRMMLGKEKVRELKREDIMEGLKKDEALWKKYENMTEKERSDFLNLSEKVYDSSSGRSNLLKLLKKDKIQNKDTTGKTLLDNLISLESQFQDGITGLNVLTQVIRSLTTPDNISRFDYPSELQKKILKNSSAEYVRIISGLTDEKGEVLLQNGEILKRSETIELSINVDTGEIYRKSIEEHFGTEKLKELQRQDIRDKIKENEKARINFEHMSEDDRERTINLMDSLYTKGLYRDILKLLERDKLYNRDSKGKTLIENLTEMNNLKPAEGLNKAGVLYTLIKNLTEPGFMELSREKNDYTHLEDMNIEKNPSEYARIMTGLTGEKGEVELQGGEILKRSLSVALKDFSSIRRIYSESIKDHMESKSKNVNKRQLIMEEIGKDEKAPNAFQLLSPKEQEKFLNMAEKTVRAGRVKIMDSEIIPGNVAECIKLLKEGKLQNKDNQNKTLLQNLIQMHHQEFAEGLEGTEIFEETLKNIAHPDRIHQGNKGTCTVTTLEYINAKTHPSEYVRIIADLTGKEGKVRLRNADIMARPEGVLQDDHSGRAPVDRIYQASMMTYAENSLEYDNKTDKFYRIEEGTGEKTEVHGGLANVYYNKASNAVLSYDSKVINIYEPGYNKFVEKEIKEALSDGYYVPVSLSWGMDSDKPTRKGEHKLSIEKIDNNYVYLRNPHGDTDRGSTGDSKTNEPVRECVYEGDFKSSGGHIKMTKEEFYSRLTGYHMPRPSRRTSFSPAWFQSLIGHHMSLPSRRTIENG